MSAEDVVWVPDRSWQTPARETTHCRVTMCTEPSVAEMDRRKAMPGSKGERWFGWCERHLMPHYFRIRGGVVEAAVRADSRDARRGWTR